jgi:beta-N-acetylhexosaminidase
LSGPNTQVPSAVIFGCAGLTLSEEEKTFFAEINPLGFILFQRNCDTPDQVRALVSSLRDCTGREDAPVLIDQEGGRVARLKPPHWRAAPPAVKFCELAKNDPERGAKAAFLNAALIAAELIELGITVDCAPVLDLPQPGADPIIGDRVAGDTPELSALLGGAACKGFLSGGVLPVIKHIPGHGRAMVDSHKELPIVETSAEELEILDFEPFRALADSPWAMTAHVVFTAYDDQNPATSSKTVIEQIIRGSIGFNGVLISDDLSMQALKGSFEERARSVLKAGCDLALHCNGDMDEMRAVAQGIAPLRAESMARVEAAEKLRRDLFSPIDPSGVAAQIDAMLEA